MCVIISLSCGTGTTEVWKVRNYVELVQGRRKRIVFRGAKRNKMIIIFIVTDRKRTYHIWEQDDNYFNATEITKH